MHLLQEQGYLEFGELGSILLTDKGRAAAEKIFERHTVIAGMRMRLGVDPETAAEDACRIGHAISDASFEAIKGHMEQMQKRRA